MRETWEDSQVFYLVSGRLRELQAFEVHPKRDIQKKFGFANVAYIRDIWVEDINVEVIMAKPWGWVNSPKERV